MKKLVVILMLLVSYSTASDGYSKGFNLYKQAKKAQRKGQIDTANKLFGQALVIFEKSKNSSQAILKTAELYCNGWGTKEDKPKAKQLLLKAKKLGASFINSECLNNLK